MGRHFVFAHVVSQRNDEVLWALMDFSTAERAAVKQSNHCAVKEVRVPKYNRYKYLKYFAGSVWSSFFCSHPGVKSKLGQMLPVYMSESQLFSISVWGFDSKSEKQPRRIYLYL